MLALVIFKILRFVQLTGDPELSLEAESINPSQGAPALEVMGGGGVVLLIENLFFHRELQGTILGLWCLFVF